MSTKEKVVAIKKAIEDYDRVLASLDQITESAKDLKLKFARDESEELALLRQIRKIL